MKQIYFLTILFICPVLLFGQADGRALNFDGVNDYVNIGTNSMFDFASGTIEALVKPTATSNTNKCIVANRSEDAKTRWSLHLNVADNKLGLYNGSFYRVIDAGTINSSTWYHVAFVIKASATSVFVDGVYKGDINIGMGSSTGNPLLIGATDQINELPIEYFQGSIDEVRIWNVTLSETEIKDRMSCELIGDETGLIAYYQFNQGFNNSDNSSVASLTDNSSNSNNGTLTNFALSGSTSNWVDNSTITTGESCSVTTSIFKSDVDYDKVKYSLFPNPSSNFIRVNGLNEVKSYNIFNAVGSEILSGIVLNNEDPINIQGLSNGVYFLKLNDKTPLKFIKK